MSQTTRQIHDAVSETLFIPLYARAREAQRPDALIKDEKAVELVKHFDFDYARVKCQAHDEATVILRLREFDRQARAFLARHPDANVVHIGCGLDTRFDRVDNGQVEWYDLDLPDVIELRRQLIGSDRERYHLLGYSAFDHAWLNAIDRSRPCLFLAEAVLVYFAEAQIKSLVLALMERFPGAELVCDAMTPFLIWSSNVQLGLSKMSARLQWGLRHPQDLESWQPGIRLLDEWYYFDRPEPRLGVSQVMRYVRPLAKGAGIFHYQLGGQ